jgi:hypothetical protein
VAERAQIPPPFGLPLSRRPGAARSLDAVHAVFRACSGKRRSIIKLADWRDRSYE